MIDVRAKALRTTMTDAERKLWQRLRARSAGAKFRRQVPLGPYIVDFVSFDPKIIIEVDGSQHMDRVQDQIRDRYFAEQGYRVMRFWNNEVLSHIDGVLDAIVDGISPSPGVPLRGTPPSPSKGRGKRAAQ